MAKELPTKLTGLLGKARRGHVCAQRQAHSPLANMADLLTNLLLPNHILDALLYLLQTSAELCDLVLDQAHVVLEFAPQCGDLLASISQPPPHAALLQDIILVLIHLDVLAVLLHVAFLLLLDLLPTPGRRPQAGPVTKADLCKTHAAAITMPLHGLPSRRLALQVIELQQALLYVHDPGLDLCEPRLQQQGRLLVCVPEVRLQAPLQHTDPCYEVAVRSHGCGGSS
mmetsp:Transcript_34022/g.72348  ORF Transcript_34022/g.72348 Transcript_34022/m.72348 type:complete len:227 (+) Transcript_34022:496-1176(+)